jgi:two-component system response regulator AtoC
MRYTGALMEDRKSGDRTKTMPESDGASQDGYTISVIGESILSCHRVPLVGETIIGRSADATINIDHPSISRRHALLRTSPTLTIEDLGSSNGTRVNGKRLKPGQPRPIAAGESIELGAVTVVALPAARAPASRPRRVMSHDFFEARLEDECGRAAGNHEGFVVVRLSVSRDVPEALMRDAVADAIGPGHPIGAYGPGEYELLLVGVAADEATASIQRAMTAKLHGLGAPLRLGVALYPHDGLTPEALMAHACRALRGGKELPAAAPAKAVVLDPAMLALYELAARVAVGNISVLLLGETGSGKEVLAETIHRRSSRRERPLLRLNCAAFTETLLESELFGYEKGAFTGATQSKPGLLETASGGTVFLDELAEMPTSIQAKLLRVVEDRTVIRVGGLKPRPIDVRFISASNRDLDADVARGLFRRDLYYRLNGVTLSIPPLRERPSEIAALAELFLSRAAAELERPVPALTAEVVERLQRYIWPGNIRELRNVMERAALLCRGRVVTLEQLPLEKMNAQFGRALPPDAAPPEAGEAGEADGERQRIIDALEQCAGNQTHAARLLGMARNTLLARLAKYQLRRPRKR